MRPKLESFDNLCFYDTSTKEENCVKEGLDQSLQNKLEEDILRKELARLRDPLLIERTLPESSVNKNDLPTINLINTLLVCNSKQREMLLDLEHKLLMAKYKYIIGNGKTHRESCNTVEEEKPQRGYLSGFLQPYFKDEQNFGADLNNDHKRKISQGCHFPYEYIGTKKHWVVTNPHNVMKAIKELIIQESEEQILCKELKEKYKTESNPKLLKEIEVKLKHATSSFNELKKKKGFDLINNKSFNENANWLKVCTNKCVEGMSPGECERTWKLLLKPKMKFQWSPVSIRKLKTLALKNDMQDWEDIAKNISPHVSSYLCFLQFCKGNNNNLLYNKGSWTKEEDENLQCLVKQCSYGKHILWGKVVYILEDRSISQILNRWYRINPNNRKGKFTDEEDKLLAVSIQEFGLDFGKITTVFGNRSPVQLRERYFTCKNTTDQLKMGEWSIQEDQLLIDLVNKFGESKWVEIAQQFPNRNRTQIRHRYNNVLKKKIKENPDLDLSTLNRHKRITHINSLNKRNEEEPNYEELKKFIATKVAKGNIVVKKCSRAGRKPKAELN